MKSKIIFRSDHSTANSDDHQTDCRVLMDVWQKGMLVLNHTTTLLSWNVQMFHYFIPCILCPSVAVRIWSRKVEITNRHAFEISHKGEFPGATNRLSWDLSHLSVLDATRITLGKLSPIRCCTRDILILLNFWPTRKYAWKIWEEGYLERVMVRVWVWVKTVWLHAPTSLVRCT